MLFKMEHTQHKHGLCQSRICKGDYAAYYLADTTLTQAQSLFFTASSVIFVIGTTLLLTQHS